MFEILLRYTEVHDWEKAFFHAIPKRKGLTDLAGESKEEEANNAMAKRDTDFRKKLDAALDNTLALNAGCAGKNGNSAATKSDSLNSADRDNDSKEEGSEVCEKEDSNEENSNGNEEGNVSDRDKADDASDKVDNASETCDSGDKDCAEAEDKVDAIESESKESKE